MFVDNINVLDLALWAEKILKLNAFLCNLKKSIHCGQLILRKISKIGATRYETIRYDSVYLTCHILRCQSCQILRLKCTKFDFR